MDNIKGNFNQNGNTDLWYLLQASFMLKNHILTIKRLLCAIKKNIYVLVLHMFCSHVH